MKRGRRDEDGPAALRVPPQSIEAEQSVLGGLLLQARSAWDVAAELLQAEDFYRYEHHLIFEAVGSLMAANAPVDVVTVFEQLQRGGQAEAAGGVAYLNSLATSVPGAANIRRYAEIVRERSIRRQMAKAGDEISTAAFEPGDRTAAEILDEAEATILSIGDVASGVGIHQGPEDMSSLLAAFIGRVKELQTVGAHDVTGVRTGFRDIDRVTAGLQPGDLIILAARPSMGKTSLALNIAANVAALDGLPVVVFSMEMGSDQLTERIASAEAQLDHARMRTARLTLTEWKRLAGVIERLCGAPLFIDQTPALRASELRARARRLARQAGQLGLVVIDYLQLMSGAGAEAGQNNRNAEVSEISRSLKALAKELQCPVMALSQLNRGVESRQDKRPMMSDLRDSGAIEQDADVVAFIYRDEYYNKDTTQDAGIAEVIFAKQRNGPVGTVKLEFLQASTLFRDVGAGGGGPGQ